MTLMFDNIQEIAGDELVEALQIKNKIPRRKALTSLEAKVLTILTEEGFVSKTEASYTPEVLPDILEDEEEDEEVVVDGEVDEGDFHIKPVQKKPTALVILGLNFFFNKKILLFFPVDCIHGCLGEFVYIIFYLFSAKMSKKMSNIPDQKTTENEHSELKFSL